MPPKKGKKAGGEADLAPILPSGTVFKNKIIRDDVQITKYLTNGGFGRIYEGKLVGKGTKVCVKVEKKGSSGLFMEQNYFIRFLKKEELDKWSKKEFIGLPTLICFGVDMASFDYELRYLVMPLYEESLEAVISKKKNMILESFEVKTVLHCIVNALDYLHNKHVSHGDIKKGNIMLLKKGHLDKVVLIDMGIAHWHTRFIEEANPKARHNGTLLYTSLDAHEGREGVFRSDLQILAFNVIEWITGELPWKNMISTPDKVYNMKKEIVADPKTKLGNILNGSGLSFVKCLLESSKSLKYDGIPNYSVIRKELVASFKDGTKRIADKPEVKRETVIKKSCSSKENGLNVEAEQSFVPRREKPTTNLFEIYADIRKNAEKHGRTIT
uniref:non-specific serine/threonine protein kinase n=1 Tax=Parastrongyloides trichosuri TaxID=131310 RepID=A0A0N4Z5U4_PARTI